MGKSKTIAIIMAAVLSTALQSAFMEAAESSDAILANVGEAFYESNDAEDRSLFNSS